MKSRVVFALIATAVAAYAQPTVPQTPEQWRQAAVRDIEDAARITFENHPGPVDPADPGFAARLEEAKKQGLRLAAKVNSPAGYIAAVERFNVAIGDGHAGMFPNMELSSQPAVRWPGFITAWRGKGLYVAAGEQGSPPAGAQVLSCDGKPIEALVRQNVFSFNGQVNEPGHWWIKARWVLLDDGNPFVSPPQRCNFAANGKTFTQTLRWRADTAQARAWRDASYNGQTLEIGITEPRSGLFWAAMPSFQPDEKQQDAYRAMFREIEEHRQRYLDADAMVIDLRRNQGGSSFWSKRFAGALWGAGRVQRRADAGSAKTETWWRATKGNTEYVAALLEKRTKANEADAVKWIAPVIEGMQAALARGEPFYVAKGASPAAGIDPKADLPGDPPPFTKPVYVIVPGQCASACLDALDVFTLFPNTKLIGAPSASDSTYMEVRFQKVESELATVIVPNKVYVNRARGNGEGYRPAIQVEDLDWSVGTFLKVVEKDLTARR